MLSSKENKYVGKSRFRRFLNECASTASLLLIFARILLLYFVIFESDWTFKKLLHIVSQGERRWERKIGT